MMQTVQAIRVNNIVVSGDGVQMVTQYDYCDRNNRIPVIIVERKQDGRYESRIRNPEFPEQGVTRCEGALLSVVQGLPDSIQTEYLQLFALTTPNEDEISRVGFDDYLVVLV